jgi:hypothetical protein
MSTVAGESLYVANGFSVVERVQEPTSRGLMIPLTRMRKVI